MDIAIDLKSTYMITLGQANILTVLVIAEKRIFTRAGYIWKIGGLADGRGIIDLAAVPEDNLRKVASSPEKHNPGKTMSELTDVVADQPAS